MSSGSGENFHNYKNLLSKGMFHLMLYHVVQQTLGIKNFLVEKKAVIMPLCLSAIRWAAPGRGHDLGPGDFSENNSKED